MGIKAPNNIDRHVGRKIRAYRQAAGLSRGAVGRRVGIFAEHVYRIEKGITRIGPGLLKKIARALDIPVTALIGTDEELTLNGPQDPNSPSALLAAPSAPRLLRAYAKIESGAVQRSMVALIEGLVHNQVGKAKKSVSSK